MLAIIFPAINPIAIQIGPVNVHWYGIAYVTGIMLGWLYANKITKNKNLWQNQKIVITKKHLNDFVTYAVIGIIIGGRLGYTIFYNPEFYVQNPAKIFAIWEGGMSFHGGTTGIIIAMIIFAKKNNISPFSLFDVIAAASCFGLALVRTANFINAELWGKVTNMPWGVIFPNTDSQPRHPSQLYEATLEGVVLFVVLNVLIFKHKKLRQPGFIGGTWLCGYAVARIISEMFREPDQQIGYLIADFVTMGMVLSIPMIIVGTWGIITAKNRTPK